ncbi:MAG TPA: sensor histidine kinase [Candidatus Limnocylindrales bacterium]|jgi:signal transduction histidine kinase
MSDATRTVPDSHGVLAQPGRPLRFAALLIALFAIAAMGLAWSAQQSQVGRVVDEAALRARGAAADVDRYVQSKWTTLKAVAAMPAFATGDPAQIRVAVEDLATRDLGFDAGFSWIDTHGLMQARSGGYDGPPIDFTDRAHIRTALETQRPTVSAALIGAVNQVPIVGFVVPTYDETGSMNGLIGSGIRLGDLSMGADTLRYAGGTGVVVVDNLGQLIAGPNPVNTLQHVADGFPLAAMQADAEGGADDDVMGPYGTPDQLVGYALAPSAGWLVLVQRSSAEAFMPATAALALQAVLIIGGSLLAVMVLLWASWRLDAAVAEQSRAYAQERATREELEAAIAALEKRQVVRDAFVGVMSHELRTPVTTIYGAAKLLAKSPRRPELETLVEDIEEEADRLHRITEDLLVLSRAEHGLVELQAEPVLVQRLIPTVIAEVRRRHPALDVELDLVPGLAPIAGDEAALRQVLVNLLQNAAKYGGGTPVLVGARRIGPDGDVHIRVEDKGPGIPAEDLEPIFDLFFRSDSNARRASGTGIGLFVVRQLVTALGGTVHAYAVEPHGLGFLVTLRAEPSGDADPLD